MRAEHRAGGIWYELVHDRYIEPILQANQAWRSRHNPLIQAAETWHLSGRNSELLYSGEQLNVALRSIDVHMLTLLEQEFLTAS